MTKAFEYLYKLYRNASALRSETAKIQAASQARKEFDEKESSGEFLTHQDRENAKNEVEKLEASGKAALKKIEKVYANAKTGAVKKVADAYMPEVIEAYDNVDDTPFAPEVGSVKGYAKDNIPHSTMSILAVVFEVLNNMLPPDQSNRVRDAVIRRFTKK